MRFKLPASSSAFALVALLSSACAADNDAKPMLRIGTHVFKVEIAATPDQRQQGLMGRKQLADNSGMLFVFDYPGRHCFWMRNTPLPLSIAFIDDLGRIVNLADMQPYTDAFHCPTAPVRYALEITHGGFTQRSIVPGIQVQGLNESQFHR